MPQFETLHFFRTSRGLFSLLLPAGKINETRMENFIRISDVEKRGVAKEEEKLYNNLKNVRSVVRFLWNTK